MRRIPIEMWLVGLVLLVNAYALFVPANSLVLAWFHSDDAFYYFKTAQNFTEGYGFTFDRIARSSGFHPLWMLVCLPVFALARFDLILPLRLLVAVSALLSAGTTVLLYRLARRSLSAPAALVMAVFWAFSPVVHGSMVKLGLEAGLSAFFIVLLFTAILNAQEVPDGILDPNVSGGTKVLLAGVVAALTVLARLDNVFLVLIAGAWLVLRPRRLRYLAVTDILLVVFSVLWSYFVRVGFRPGYEAFSLSSYWMAALALLIRLPFYYLFRLYHPPEYSLPGMIGQMARAVAASLLSSALLSGLMLGLFALGVFPGFPRLVLGYEAVFSLAALVITRLAAALLAWKAQAPEGSLRWLPALTRLGLFFAPIGLAMIVYIGFNLAYFGTSSPVSGQIKRWWGTLPSPLYGQPAESLSELLGLAGKNEPWELLASLAQRPRSLPGAARAALVGIPTLALLLGMLRRTTASIDRLALYPLFVGGLVQLLSYTGTGYIHTRPWYWAAQHLLGTLLLGLVLDNLLHGLSLFRAIRGSPPAAWITRYGLPALLAGWLVISFSAGLVKSMPPGAGPGTAEDYLGGTRALEAATEPGARIGSTGGGIIAYFLHDRTMVNLDGLMNGTEYFALLKEGRASDYLNQIGLKYVFTNEYGITSSDPYFQFKDHLQKIRDIGGSALFYWLP